LPEFDKKLAIFLISFIIKDKPYVDY